ncbi:type II toxin-antitoxin system RelE/ParE family toxin [Flavobacterium sp. CS20]|uniref:type II toxin-antitoxin system RelE family toxin n=1 Tax=Flavobacterium sp. CS20 TaxID=2775246 RepID=UPI001FFDEAF5|nr:hypothetical protein [Flavobacterium sp. CS20]
MSYSIIPTHRFEKELKRLAKKFPSLKNEFAELIAEISENPEAGTFIGNNCYKIRLAIASKGKGKRGGARVVTHLHSYRNSLPAYHLRQGRKTDLKPNELKEMIENLELD